MTAVLAAARAALYAVLGAALVLVAVAAMLFPAYGPQGFWTVAWLGVTAVTVAGCAVALEWLGKRRRKEALVSERLRWKLWGLACRLPRVCPASAAGALLWGTRPLREMAVDDACLRDCTPGESCWCGKLRRAGETRDG